MVDLKQIEKGFLPARKPFSICFFLILEPLFSLVFCEEMQLWLTVPGCLDKILALTGTLPPVEMYLFIRYL
ncbi:hypothetical protein DCO56_15950 [Sphingobacterium athyrii]|uniref:Uncharacterized protein n=1 Tax=Sphingobacterium athyrii TaxID=2152717 RepID=A0A363NRI1_9SPHI|nr:hypothetical protein DCO56_15950 [Sphingobacterium athyrii]